MFTFYINCGSGYAITSSEPTLTDKFLVEINLPEGMVLPVLISQINGLIASARTTPEAINATIVKVNFG